MKKAAFFAVAAIAGVAVLWALQSGVFYQTGTQWFHSCWAKMEATPNLFREAHPANEIQAVDWAACDLKAGQAIYRVGLIVTWFPDGAPNSDAKELQTACPDGFREIPFGGPYVLAMQLIEESGGPSLIDRVLPADHLLERTWLKHWPQCVAVRQRQGYPRVEMNETVRMWGWADPCDICDQRGLRLNKGYLMSAAQKSDQKTSTSPFDRFLELQRTTPSQK